MPFGADGNFTNEALLNRINADLANDLGNLLSRTVAMIEKYFGGAVPAMAQTEEVDNDLIALAEALPAKVERASWTRMQFSAALTEIWKLVGECNRYIDLTQPWVLGRSEEGKRAPEHRAVLRWRSAAARWRCCIDAVHAARRRPASSRSSARDRCRADRLGFRERSSAGLTRRHDRAQGGGALPAHRHPQGDGRAGRAEP